MGKHGVDPGDHDRLRSAFERHYEGLVRLATGLCLRQDLAEDIVQEAFVRAAPRIDAVSDAALGAYLRSSVVNLWKNRLRRLAIERRHTSPRREESPDPTSGVDQHDEIWRLLGELSDRQRVCVVLRFYEDLTEHDVARVLGCSTGAVKSHTSRALQRLAKELTRDA